MVNEGTRERHQARMVENFWQDVKFAARTLARARAYSLAAIAALSIGVGSMTTVVCGVAALLWTPLPFPAAQRLVAIEENDPRGGRWPFSEPDFVDLAARATVLDNVAGYRMESLALTSEGEPETIHAAVVTGSAFSLLGMRPLVGRAFAERDKEVVISRRLWKRKWQANPLVVGRVIALDNQAYRVAGVVDIPSDLWPGVDALAPLEPDAAASRSAHDVEVFGRVRTGLLVTQAQAQTDDVARAIGRENAGTHAGWTFRLLPLFDAVVGERTARTTWMILGAVGLFWLLTCANVAGLQLARNIARRGELSTRVVLGASRARLLEQVMTEGLLLSLLGGFLGIVVAYAGISVIRVLSADAVPRLAAMRLDGKTLAIAGACVLLSLLLSTAFSGRMPDFQGGRASTRRDSGRDLLIAVEVALATILLVGASLLFQSFVRLQAVNPGFDPERVLAVRVDLPRAGDPARRLVFFQTVTERLEQMPQVASAGATNVPPFSGYGTANRFRLEGEATTGTYRSAAWRAVTPDFFRTLGIPLKRGRVFDARDVDGATEVVLVSESMAQRFWPDEDPIGKRLLWGKSGNPKTIVGVVGDLRDLSVDAVPVPTMFRPYAQLSDPPMTLLIRTKADPIAVVNDVRRVVRAVDSKTALEFETVQSAMSHSILRPRISATAFAIFGGIALLTAAVGLYGLISYRVTQRQQEIGIRLALGSTRGRVQWTVQWQSLRLILWGLAIGLPAGAGLSRYIRSLLYETSPLDATAYAAVLLAFAAIGLVASFGPARRAARLDPSAAIRHE